MRRFIAPSSLVFLVASVCVLALSTPAGASGSGPIVCPQARGPMIVPCCPVPIESAHSRPDVVPCCPTPTNGSCCSQGTTCCSQGTTCCTQGTTCCTGTCTPGDLTIASSPDPSLAGHKVVISGGMTLKPTAGTQVVLWRELIGQTSFHQVTQTTTDSAGQYRITLNGGMVNADQQFYVTAGGLQSPTLHQQVNALVALSASRRSVGTGTPITLRGHVTPSHAGETVLIEQLFGKRWMVVARSRLGHASNYTLSHRFQQAGGKKLKAVLLADARNARSSSPTVTVTVK
jgi:hypothetical protein